MGLGTYFHSVTHPTDTIKAVDYGSSVDGILDSLIFSFVPNLATLAFATTALAGRYGSLMVVTITFTAVIYCIVEKSA